MIPGTDASSAEFRKYDQVEKAHTYRLAEHENDEFDEHYRIATLDLARFLRGDARERAQFAAEFVSALSDIGFAVLVGHGIDVSLYDRVDEAILDLFTSTPLEEKMRFEGKRHGSVAQGYFPIEHTSEIHPDLVEGWVFCRRAFNIDETAKDQYRPQDYWPDERYEREFRPLVLAHQELFKPVAQAMLQGLGCDPHLLDQKLTGTNLGLRLNYYPAMSAEQDHSGAARLLGHEDVDLFTLLPASRVDGLQVWNHRSCKWVRLSPPRGSLIINTGDYMQRMSNDRLKSTTHRVGKPTDASHLRKPRVSFATNVYLWEDEMLEVFPGLEPAKYPPIKAITFHTRSTSKFYGEGYAVEQA
jgi:isopenicillin N synthase-like dioxygenase